MFCTVVSIFWQHANREFKAHLAPPPRPHGDHLFARRSPRPAPEDPHREAVRAHGLGEGMRGRGALRRVLLGARSRSRLLIVLVNTRIFELPRGRCTLKSRKDQQLPASCLDRETCAESC